jgi:hypothetical protein
MDSLRSEAIMDSLRSEVVMDSLRAVAVSGLLAVATSPAVAGPAAFSEFPRVQIVPQPGTQFSFQVDGREVLRYLAGPEAAKPYFFPVLGPCGRPVTRIGHPRDPVTHGHHLSLWIGHKDVGGANFWEHGPKSGRIVHDRILKLDDGSAATLAARATWVDVDGKALLADERVWTLTPVEGTAGENGFGELTLDLDLTLSAAAAPVTLGKTPFGLLAVRVAKTMGVNDGGGRITNSEGKTGEAEIFWKPARWCDYSGPAAPGVLNGITIFDHPKNPGHPTAWHVRGDGWMGASVTQGGAVEVSKANPLALRYRIWVHRGACDAQAVEERWKRWAEADTGE